MLDVLITLVIGGVMIAAIAWTFFGGFISSERTAFETAISLKDAEAALEAAVQSYEAAHQNDVPEEIF